MSFMRYVKKGILYFLGLKCAPTTTIQGMRFNKKKLISYLPVVKQNNKLLMKNHESRLTNLTLFPETNASRYNNNCGWGRGYGWG